MEKKWRKKIKCFIHYFHNTLFLKHSLEIIWEMLKPLIFKALHKTICGTRLNGDFVAVSFKFFVNVVKA